MSGIRTTTTPTTQLNRVNDPVRAADINSIAQQIETADRANVKRGQETYFPALLLRGSDGATYRLTVTVTAGVPAVTLAVVPR